MWPGIPSTEYYHHTSPGIPTTNTNFPSIQEIGADGAAQLPIAGAQEEDKKVRSGRSPMKKTMERVRYMLYHSHTVINKQRRTCCLRDNPSSLNKRMCGFIV